MSAIAWIAANGVTLALLVMLVGGWGRSRPDLRSRVAIGALCLLLVPVVFFLRPVTVPTGSVTVLMEGPSIRNVQQLYGEAAHAGTGFYLLGERLAGHGVGTLRALVDLNAHLLFVNTVLFFLIAAAALESWVAAVVFAWGYASNLNTLHAAYSETPAMLWTTHFWLGCIAGGALGDRDAPAWLRRVAWSCLVMLTGLAALLRVELLVLSAPAVVLGAAAVLGWEAPVQRAARRFGGWVLALLRAPLGIFLLVCIPLAWLEFVSWSGTDASWIIAGLRPFNFSFLTLPGSLSVFLPFGFILLFLLGIVYTLRRWFSFLLLPVSLLVLFKIYGAAAHGVFFERFRYLTFLTPVVLFIGLFGFGQLADWARRWQWPAWWRRLTWVLLLASLHVWQAPGPKEFFRRRQTLPGVTTDERLLGWNQQTEVRYLLDLIDRYPECVFLAKTPGASSADTRSGSSWVVFGAPVPYRETADSGSDVQEVVHMLAPRAQCVLFYRSLDCNRADVDPCERETHGRVALEERVFENLPYSDISEYGAHRAEIRLAVYPLVSAPPGSVHAGAASPP